MMEKKLKIAFDEAKNQVDRSGNSDKKAELNNLKKVSKIMKITRTNINNIMKMLIFFHVF